MFDLLADYITYELLNLEKGSGLGESVNFFIYDVTKILFLLAVMVFSITFLRSYFSVEKTRRLLSGKKLGLGNFLASLLGSVTPFCSCSSVPLFIGFVEAGIPLGVTFSFLITSPLVNEIAVALLYSIFGLKVTLLYALSGIFIGFVLGLILGAFKLERYVEGYVFNLKVGEIQEQKLSLSQRAKLSYEDAKGIIKKVLPFVIAGVGIGAIIHGYVPRQEVEAVLKEAGKFSVIAAVFVGIPLYSNAAGLIPVAQALVEKGIPLGTALAFMMATTALSAPEAVILRKVLKPRLIAIFFFVTALGIVAIGYIFNIILA